MPDVLIRAVPGAELTLIRADAAAKGVSLQRYLSDLLRDQATCLRRQAALRQTAQRLEGRPAVAADDRNAVLDAMAAAYSERADRLSGRVVP